MYIINNLPSSFLLGYQGEKNVTSLNFDMSTWLDEYPTGITAIVVQRPGETEAQAYTALGVSTTNNICTWIVDNIDTTLFGRGLMSVVLSTPEQVNIKKTRPRPIIITESLTAVVPPPAAIDQWIIQANSILNNLIANPPQISGSGIPETNAAFLGQIYIDTLNHIGYLAVQIGTGITDWHLIT